MDERTKILSNYCKKILIFHDDLFKDVVHSTNYAKAVCMMVERACSLLVSISLLIEKRLVADSAILFRSMMNLFWNYLFLTGAKLLPTGKWKYENAPAPNSMEFQRAERFMSWHWVDAYRNQTKTKKIVRMFNELKDKYGYQTDKQVPDCWYAEPTVGVLDRNIKSIAKFVGAEQQYDEDYKHLSGIEHSDITSVMVDNDNRAGDDGYGHFVYFKAIQFVAQMIDMAVLVIGKTHTEDEKNLYLELKALNESIYAEIRKNEEKSDQMVI